MNPFPRPEKFAWAIRFKFSVFITNLVKSQKPDFPLLREEGIVEKTL
jgi:hypothetical protein